jgi:Mismatch repair ATPase (MutS family)
MHDLDALFFSAELGGAPELDLHGMNSDIAIGELDYFLNRQWHHKEPIIKIIHGRGSGILRQAIHTWLKQHKKLILAFRDSTQLDEAGAVTYIALAPIRRPNHPVS